MVLELSEDGGVEWAQTRLRGCLVELGEAAPLVAIGP